MFYDKDLVQLVGALTDAGTLVWAPGEAVLVKRFIHVTTTAYTVANGGVTVARRNVDDSTSVNIMSYVIPFTGSALNKVMFANVREPPLVATTGIDGSVVYLNTGAGHLSVQPGQELLFTDAGTQTAGASALYVEYIPGGFNEKQLYGAATVVPLELVVTLL